MKINYENARSCADSLKGKTAANLGDLIQVGKRMVEQEVPEIWGGEDADAFVSEMLKLLKETDAISRKASELGTVIRDTADEMEEAELAAERALAAAAKAVKDAANLAKKTAGTSKNSVGATAGTLTDTVKKAAETARAKAQEEERRQAEEAAQKAVKMAQSILKNWMKK